MHKNSEPTSCDSTAGCRAKAAPGEFAVPQPKPSLQKNMNKRILLCVASVLLTLMAVKEAVAQTYSNAVMALNPVAYWPLTETTQPPFGAYIATNIGTVGTAGNGF